MMFASASAGKINEGRCCSVGKVLILLYIDVWIVLRLENLD